MKTRKLRLLSALLALAMLFALMPTAAFADDSTENNIITYNCGENGNNVTATLNTVTGVMTISGTGAMKDYNVINPDQPWLSQRDSIKHLVVENGVTSIGKNAFANCLSLETVELPQNGVLETIKYNAFSWSYSSSEVGAGITEITIPKSVKTIEAYAFDGCTKLATVIFAKGSQLNVVEYDAFRDCSDVTIYYSDENVKTRLSGIVDADRIKLLTPTVTFVSNGGSNVEPATVKNGEKISAPADPTRDGWTFAGWYTKNADGKWADEAFDFDNTLITDNMTLYARWTVDGKCGNNLTWILDSDGTLTISGSGAMADYSGPSSQPWADQRSSINRVVIGDEVTSIGKNAFANCPGLKVVELPENGALETIKYNAFSWLGSSSEDGAGITEITIPKSVKEIEKFAFDGCTKLATVTFAPVSELETIGSMAFRNTGISEISIPASVKKIGYFKDDGVPFEDDSGEVFNGCTKLKKVIFESPSSLENVARYTFAGCFTTVYGTVYGDDNVMSKLKGIVDADKIKPLTPTVTFDSNGGSKVDSQKVTNGTAATKPAVPTRKGWKFIGWYTKDADGKWAAEPFDFNTLITDNMTLYARWETKLVDITPAAELYPIAVDCGTAYDAEGNPIEKAAAGDVVTIKADETAFDGMAFERWEVRKGEVKLENDRAAKTSFTMPEGEVQLEAMYQAADSNDSGWDAATVVTGVAIGTGTAILAYHIGMEVYAEQVLGKDVAVPRTRGEVALLAWQLAGSPEPNAAFELLTDEAKAQQWAVESGLMQPDAEGNFHAEKKLSKLKALRVLDAAKKLV